MQRGTRRCKYMLAYVQACELERHWGSIFIKLVIYFETCGQLTASAWLWPYTFVIIGSSILATRRETETTRCIMGGRLAQKCTYHTSGWCSNDNNQSNLNVFKSPLCLKVADHFHSFDGLLHVSALFPSLLGLRGLPGSNGTHVVWILNVFFSFF